MFRVRSRLLGLEVIIGLLEHSIIEIFVVRAHRVSEMKESTTYDAV